MSLFALKSWVIARIFFLNHFKWAEKFFLKMHIMAQKSPPNLRLREKNTTNESREDAIWGRYLVVGSNFFSKITFNNDVSKKIEKIIFCPKVTKNWFLWEKSRNWVQVISVEIEIYLMVRNFWFESLQVNK